MVEVTERLENPIDEYKRAIMRNMSLLIPTLTEKELSDAVDASIHKRFKDANCTLYNNYKDQELDTTLSKMSEYIASKKPIVTAYGVLFSKHGDVKNPLYDFIESLADLRSYYKDEMFKYPKGTEMYNRYNLLQSLAKIDMNGLYGTFGSPSSIFFNLHVAPAITSMGQSIISTSITFFESFLANNVPFGSMEEVIMFIDNVRMETPNRKFRDCDIVDTNVTLPKCFFKILATCGYNWVPSKDDAHAIWDILSRVSQEDLNRIYYKNNLFEFCDNSKIRSMLVSMLCKLNSPFLNPNKVPPEIKDDIELLLDYIKEYVYYEYITLDKIDRVDEMPRSTVLIVDTDSCIVSLDAWYHFVVEMTHGIDMKIKHNKYDVIKLIEADEFGDMPKVKPIEYVDYSYDYDFFNDELTNQRRMINPMTLIPEDGLRCSIIDIMSYVVSQLILSYMSHFAAMYHSDSPGRKCLLIAKNEFLFKSLLLTYVKKHYGSNTLVQEGHAVPKSAALGITGLELDKAGMPKSTADELKRILFEEILDTETGVDQIQVMKSLAILEKKIYLSLQSGETTYHKPARIKPMSSYATPMHIQGIKASYAYNFLKPEDGRDPIDLEKRNALLIIKTKVDKKNVSSFNIPEEMCNKAKELLATQEYKSGINSIAIPFGEPIPDWVIELIDYSSIINDNLKGFPSDSINICTVNNSNIPYSNIVSL